MFYLLCLQLILAVCGASISPYVIKEELLWMAGTSSEINTFRTPILVNTPGGLLAFAGGRKYSSSDESAKVIAMRRSLNGGESWEASREASRHILDDHLKDNGYLNLGSVIVDYEKNITFLNYCFCIHNVCEQGYKPANFMMKSSDWGKTWTKPEDLSEKNAEFKDWMWCSGPGYGIQKKYPPHKGRLIACGHIIRYQEVLCITSDDHGETWQIGSGLPCLPYKKVNKTGDFVPGEIQPVELPDGSVLASIRNAFAFHCHCRMHARSYDGASSFDLRNLTLEESLPDPGCLGSMTMHTVSGVSNTLFFSNPSNLSNRVNMTVRWSDDLGHTWPQQFSLIINPGESAYSCLSPIDYNSVGLLYEKSTSLSFVKIKLI